jgi:hypothetical protein
MYYKIAFDISVYCILTHNTVRFFLLRTVPGATAAPPIVSGAPAPRVRAVRAAATQSRGPAISSDKSEGM